MLLNILQLLQVLPPGNSKAERVPTTTAEAVDGDKNFMTLASAVSELSYLDDATFADLYQ